MRTTQATGETPHPKPPRYVCLDSEGKALPRLTAADADELIGRGWARWSGKGSKRHVRLLESAPLTYMPSRSAGTQPDRADYLCRIYAAGQPFKPWAREHRPL